MLKKFYVSLVNKNKELLREFYDRAQTAQTKKLSIGDIPFYLASGIKYLTVGSLISFSKFLILIFESPENVYKVFAELAPEAAVKETPQEYKDYQRKVRVFSLTGLTVLISGVVVVSLVLNLILPAKLTTFGATFTQQWTTTGDFTTNANTNQGNTSTAQVVTTGDNVELSSTSSSITKTTTSDFTGGTLFQTEILNNSVKLAETGYQNKILNTAGLVSYWKMDDNWQDSKGLNHGTANGGAVFGAAKYGSASGNFDGVDDWVDVANESNFDMATNISVEAWVKAAVSQPGADGGGLFHFLDKSHGYTDITGWYLLGNSNGKVNFGFGDGSDWGANVASTTNVKDNNWHHIVGTYDGSIMKIYVDGVLENSKSETASIALNNRNVQMGSAWGGGTRTRWFTGLLDEVAVYNTVLTANVITDHYTAYYSSGTYESSSIDLGQKSNLTSLTLGTSSTTTKFLSHFDGADGSTVFTDSSLSNHTVSSNVNAQIDTAFKKFGTGSALFDGSSYLTAVDSDDFDFTNGDFTIDFWYKDNGSVGLYPGIVSRIYNDYYPGWLITANSGSLQFWATSNGGNWDIANGSNLGTYSNSIFNHYAITREGNNFYFFKNGVQQSTVSSSGTILNEIGDLNIGRYYSGRYINGAIDEFRISKGIALWSSNFTSPASQYDNEIALQIAANNDNSTWNYLGPDGTASTYYTASGVSISSLSGNRYIKYKAYLSTNNTSSTPSFDDIAIHYSYYISPGTITNLKMDALSDAAFSKIEWNGATPSGTAIKFRTRGVPNSQFTNDCSTTISTVNPSWSQSYYTTSGATIVDQNGSSSPLYRCLETELTLTSDGQYTPTLNDFTITYAQNVSPDVQSVSASQGFDGLAPITFQVRDSDTLSGTTQSGYIDATVEYCSNYTTSCQTWTQITAAALDWAGVGAVGASANARKLPVNTSTPTNYTSYSVSWNPNTDASNLYLSNTQIRIVANDREGINNQGLASSTAFVLDTKTPTVSTKRIIVSTNDVSGISVPSFVLGASDDSPLQMKISNSADLAGANWEAYGTDGNSDGYGDTPLSATITKAWTFSGDPATVYFKLKDKYGNETGISSWSAPRAPSNVFYQDISNVATNEYREFYAWSAISAPSQGFGSYQVYRSTDGANYSLASEISSISTNYLIDLNLTSNTNYYYKVRAVSSSNNDYSGFSSAISDRVDGQGGTDITAPTISSISVSDIQTTSATISWTTDEHSNTAVLSEGTPAFSPPVTSIDQMVTSHSITVTNLTPNTVYSFKVRSADPNGNTTTSSVQQFTTLSGPVISDIFYSDLTDTSVKIKWTTDISAGSEVRYSASSDLSNSMVVSDDTSTTGHTVSLTGLTRGTKYYYQVKSGVAIDNNGGSYYTFTTTQDTASPDISVTNPPPIITSNSAAINWTTSEPSTSQVCYNVIPEDLANCTTLDTTLVSNHNVFISGLTDDAKYYYRVKSKDAQNNLTESSVYNFTTSRIVLGGGGGGGSTLKDSTAPQIIRPEATNITDTQALIVWETDEDSSSFVEYGKTVQYGELAGRFEDKIKHNVQLLKLEQGATYHFRVISQDAAGNKGYSKDAQFKTLGTKEATVGEITKIESLNDINQITRSIENLLAGLSQKISSPKIAGGTPKVETTSTSALITWVTDRQSNSIVAFASEADYKPDAEEQYLSQTGDPDEQVITHKVLINNLLPGTTYHYQLRSKGIIGDLGKSNDMTFTTKSEASIFGLEITDVTKNSVTIKWKTNVITTSRVQYGLSTDYGLSVSDPSFNTAHIVKLTNLTSGTFYHFRVGGIDQQRIGFWSPDLTFTTTALPSLINVKINETTATSLVVSWNTNVLSDSFIEYTNVRTKEKLTFGDKALTANHLLKVENLGENTEYEFAVSSTDVNQNTITSSLYRIQTVSDTFGPDIMQVQSQSAVAGIKGDKIQTIITWKTDEPATSKIIYQEGLIPNLEAEKSTALDKTLAQNHTVVITAFKPGTVYRYRVESVDSAGNVSVSNDFTLLTPSQRETVIDLIIKNFQDLFGWTQKLR